MATCTDTKERMETVTHMEMEMRLPVLVALVGIPMEEAEDGWDVSENNLHLLQCLHFWGQNNISNLSPTKRIL